MNVSPNWRAAVEGFIRELKVIYGPRLHGVFLYGSRARGDAEDASDIDTLVVLDPLTNFWTEFALISPIASRLSLDYDVVISAIPADLQEFQEARTPLILNVRREGLRVA